MFLLAYFSSLSFPFPSNVTKTSENCCSNITYRLDALTTTTNQGTGTLEHEIQIT